MYLKSDSFNTLPLNPFILGNDRKRVRFKPGQEEKYLKSLKRVLLQPYFEINYSESYLAILSKYVVRFIKYCKTHATLTPNTVNEVMKLVIYLHNYNVNTAKETSKYPWCPEFTDVLLEYVILECNILYTIHFGSTCKEKVTQTRILRLLMNIIGTFYEYEGIPGAKILNESAKIILKICKRIRKTYDVKYNILESITRKLLDKLGVLQQMEGLSRHRSNSGSSENLLKSKLENEYDIHRLFEENESKEYTFQAVKKKNETSHVTSSDFNSLNKNNQKVKEYVGTSSFSSGIIQNSSVNAYGQMSHKRYTPSNVNYQSSGFNDQNNSSITSLIPPAFNAINLNAQNSNVNIQIFGGKSRPQINKERINHIAKQILLKDENNYEIQEAIIISDDDDDDLTEIKNETPVSSTYRSSSMGQDPIQSIQESNGLSIEEGNNSHKNSNREENELTRNIVVSENTISNGPMTKSSELDKGPMNINENESEDRSTQKLNKPLNQQSLLPTIPKSEQKSFAKQSKHQNSESLQSLSVEQGNDSENFGKKESSLPRSGSINTRNSSKLKSDSEENELTINIVDSENTITDSPVTKSSELENTATQKLNEPLNQQSSLPTIPKSEQKSFTEQSNDQNSDSTGNKLKKESVENTSTETTFLSGDNMSKKTGQLFETVDEKTKSLAQNEVLNGSIEKPNKSLQSLSVEQENDSENFGKKESDREENELPTKIVDSENTITHSPMTKSSELDLGLKNINEKKCEGTITQKLNPPLNQQSSLPTIPKSQQTSFTKQSNDQNSDSTGDKLKNESVQNTSTETTLLSGYHPKKSSQLFENVDEKTKSLAQLEVLNGSIEKPNESLRSLSVEQGNDSENFGKKESDREENELTQNIVDSENTITDSPVTKSSELDKGLKDINENTTTQKLNKPLNQQSSLPTIPKSEQKSFTEQSNDQNSDSTGNKLKKESVQNTSTETTFLSGDNMSKKTGQLFEIVDEKTKSLAQNEVLNGSIEKPNKSLQSLSVEQENDSENFGKKESDRKENELTTIIVDSENTITHSPMTKSSELDLGLKNINEKKWEDTITQKLNPPLNQQSSLPTIPKSQQTSFTKQSNDQNSDSTGDKLKNESVQENVDEKTKSLAQLEVLNGSIEKPNESLRSLSVEQGNDSENFGKKESDREENELPTKIVDSENTITHSPMTKSSELDLGLKNINEKKCEGTITQKLNPPLNQQSSLPTIPKSQQTSFTKQSNDQNSDSTGDKLKNESVQENVDEKTKSLAQLEVLNGSIEKPNESLRSLSVEQGNDSENVGKKESDREENELPTKIVDSENTITHSPMTKSSELDLGLKNINEKKCEGTITQKLNPPLNQQSSLPTIPKSQQTSFTKQSNDQNSDSTGDKLKNESVQENVDEKTISLAQLEVLNGSIEKPNESLRSLSVEQGNDSENVGKKESDREENELPTKIVDSENTITHSPMTKSSELDLGLKNINEKKCEGTITQKLNPPLNQQSSLPTIPKSQQTSFTKQSNDQNSDSTGDKLKNESVQENVDEKTISLAQLEVLNGSIEKPNESLRSLSVEQGNDSENVGKKESDREENELPTKIVDSENTITHSPMTKSSELDLGLKNINEKKCEGTITQKLNPPLNQQSSLPTIPKSQQTSFTKQSNDQNSDSTGDKLKNESVQENVDEKTKSLAQLEVLNGSIEKPNESLRSLSVEQGNDSENFGKKESDREENELPTKIVDSENTITHGPMTKSSELDLGLKNINEKKCEGTITQKLNPPLNQQSSLPTIPKSQQTSFTKQSNDQNSDSTGDKLKNESVQENVDEKTKSLAQLEVLNGSIEKPNESLRSLSVEQGNDSENFGKKESDREENELPTKIVDSENTITHSPMTKSSELDLGLKNINEKKCEGTITQKLNPPLNQQSSLPTIPKSQQTSFTKQSNDQNSDSTGDKLKNESVQNTSTETTLLSGYHPKKSSQLFENVDEKTKSLAQLEVLNGSIEKPNESLRSLSVEQGNDSENFGKKESDREKNELTQNIVDSENTITDSPVTKSSELDKGLKNISENKSKDTSTQKLNKPLNQQSLLPTIPKIEQIAMKSSEKASSEDGDDQKELNIDIREATKKNCSEIVHEGIIEIKLCSSDSADQQTGLSTISEEIQKNHLVCSIGDNSKYNSILHKTSLAVSNPQQTKDPSKELNSVKLCDNISNKAELSAMLTSDFKNPKEFILKDSEKASKSRGVVEDDESIINLRNSENTKTEDEENFSSSSGSGTANQGINDSIEMTKEAVSTVSTSNLNSKQKNYELSKSKNGQIFIKIINNGDPKSNLLDKVSKYKTTKQKLNENGPQKVEKQLASSSEQSSSTKILADKEDKVAYQKTPKKLEDYKSKHTNSKNSDPRLANTRRNKRKSSSTSSMDKPLPEDEQNSVAKQEKSNSTFNHQILLDSNQDSNTSVDVKNGIRTYKRLKSLSNYKPHENQINVSVGRLESHCKDLVKESEKLLNERQNAISIVQSQNLSELKDLVKQPVSYECKQKLIDNQDKNRDLQIEMPKKLFVDQKSQKLKVNKDSQTQKSDVEKPDQSLNKKRVTNNLLVGELQSPERCELICTNVTTQMVEGSTSVEEGAKEIQSSQVHQPSKSKRKSHRLENSAEETENKDVLGSLLDVQKSIEVVTTANPQTQLTEKHIAKSNEDAPENSELLGLLTVEKENNSKTNKEIKLLPKDQDSTTSRPGSQVVKSKDCKSTNDQVKLPNISKSKGIPGLVLDIQKTPEVNTSDNLSVNHSEKSSKSAYSELSGITTVGKENNLKSNEEIKLLPKYQNSITSSKSRNDQVKPSNVTKLRGVPGSDLDVQKTSDVNTSANLHTQLPEKHSEKSSESAYSELSRITTVGKENNSTSNEEIKLLPKYQDSTTSTTVSQVVKSKNSKSRNDQVEPSNVTKLKGVPGSVSDVQKTSEVNTSANLHTQLPEKHSKKVSQSAYSELSGITTVEKENNSKTNKEIKLLPKDQDSTTSRPVSQVVKSKDCKSTNDQVKLPNISKSKGIHGSVLDIQKTYEVNTSANLQTQLSVKHIEKSSESAYSELSETTTVEKENNSKTNKEIKLLPKDQDSTTSRPVSQVVKSKNSKSRNDQVKPSNVTKLRGVPGSDLDVQKTSEVNTSANLHTQLPEKHSEKSSESAYSELSRITTVGKENNSTSNEEIKLLPKYQDSTTSTTVSQVVKSKNSKSRNDQVKPSNVTKLRGVPGSDLDVQKTSDVNTSANLHTQLPEKHSEKSSESAYSELSRITTVGKENNSTSNEEIKLLPKYQDSTTSTTVSQVVKSKNSKSRNDQVEPSNVTKLKGVPGSVSDVQKTSEVNTSANLHTQLPEKHSKKVSQSAYSELSGITTVEKENNSKTNKEIKLLPKDQDSTTSRPVSQVVKSKDCKSTNDQVKLPNISKSKGIHGSVLDIQKTYEVNTSANLQTQLSVKHIEKSSESAYSELSETTTVEKENNSKTNKEIKLLPKDQDSTTSRPVSQVVKSKNSKSRNDQVKPSNVTKLRGVPGSDLDVQKTSDVNTSANLHTQLPEKHSEKSSESAYSELSRITTVGKENNSTSNEEIKLLPKYQDSTTSTTVSQVVKSKNSKSRNDQVEPSNVTKLKGVPGSVSDVQKTSEVNTSANLHTQLPEKHSKKVSQSAYSELSGITTVGKENNSKFNEEIKLLPKCQDSTTSASVSQVVKSKDSKSRNYQVTFPNVESSQSKNLPLLHESYIENEETLGVPVSNEELKNNVKDASKTPNVVNSISESQKSTEILLADQKLDGSLRKNDLEQNNKRKLSASDVCDLQTRKLRKSSKDCESQKIDSCDKIRNPKGLETSVTNSKRRISDFQEEELKQFCQETGKSCLPNSNPSKSLNNMAETTLLRNIPSMKNKLNAKLLENKTTDSKMRKVGKSVARKYTNKKSCAQSNNKNMDDCVTPSKNDSLTENSESNKKLSTSNHDLEDILPSNPKMTRKLKLDDMTIELANEDDLQNILSVEPPQKSRRSKSKLKRHVSRKMLNHEISEAPNIPGTEKIRDTSSGADKLKSETSSFKLETTTYPTETQKQDLKPPVIDELNIPVNNLKRTKASQKCFEVKSNDQILLENDTDKTEIPLMEPVSDTQNLQDCSSIENIDRSETRSVKKSRSISENIFDPIELNSSDSCTSSVGFVESMFDVQEEVVIETTPLENNETIQKNEMEDVEDVPLSKRLEDLKKQNITISQTPERSSELVENYNMTLTKNLNDETVLLNEEVAKNEKLENNQLSPITEGNTENADKTYSHKKLRRESFHQQGSRDFVSNTPSTADLRESQKNIGKQEPNDHVPSTPTTTELFSNLKSTVAPTYEKLRRKLEKEFTNTARNQSSEEIEYCSVSFTSSKPTKETSQGKNPKIHTTTNLRRSSRRTQENQNNPCDSSSIEGSLNYEVGISKESLQTQGNTKSIETEETRTYSSDNKTANKEIPDTKLLKSNGSNSNKRKKINLTVPQVDVKESFKKKTNRSSFESNNFKKSSHNVKICQRTQGMNETKNSSAKKDDKITKTVSESSEIICQPTTNSSAIDHLMSVVTSELEQVVKASQNVYNQQLADVRIQQISPGNLSMNTSLFDVITNHILEAETDVNTKIQDTVSVPETETFVETTIGENPCSTTTDFHKQSETSNNRKRTLDKDEEDENEEIALKQQKIMEMEFLSKMDPISLVKQMPDDVCSLLIIPVEGVPEIGNEINLEALAGVDVDNFIPNFPLLEEGNTTSNTKKNQYMDTARNTDHDYQTIGVQDCYLHIGTPVNMEQKLINQSTGKSEDQRSINCESIHTENSQSMQSGNSPDNQNDNQTDPDNSEPSISVFHDFDDFLESFNYSGQPEYHIPCVNPNEVQNDTNTSKLPESPQFKSFSRKDSNDETTEKKDIPLQNVENEDCQTSVAKDLLNDIANIKFDTKLTTENSTNPISKPTVSSTTSVPQQRRESPQSNNKPCSNILQNLSKNNGAKVLVMPINQSEIIDYVNRHSYATADSSVTINKSGTTETRKPTFPPERTYSRSRIPRSPKNKIRRNQAVNENSSKITMEDLVYHRKLRNKRRPEPPESAPVLSVIEDGVEVTWPNNGNKNIDAYVVEYSVEGSKKWKTHTCNGNSSSYIVTDLQLGQTYMFRLKVYNVFGYSPYTPLSKIIYSDNNVKGHQSPKSVTASASLDTEGLDTDLQKGAPQLNYSIDSILKNSQNPQLKTSSETNQNKDVLFDQVRDSSYVNDLLQKKLTQDNKFILEPVGVNKKPANDLPILVDEVNDKQRQPSNPYHCNRGSVPFPTKSRIKEENKDEKGMDWHSKYHDLCVQRNQKPLPNSVPDDSPNPGIFPENPEPITKNKNVPQTSFGNLRQEEQKPD